MAEDSLHCGGHSSMTRHTMSCPNHFSLEMIWDADDSSLVILLSSELVVESEQAFVINPQFLSFVCIVPGGGRVRSQLFEFRPGVTLSPFSDLGQIQILSLFRHPFGLVDREAGVLF
jgi:hypothetical protein